MELHNIQKALAQLDNLEDYHGPKTPITFTTNQTNNSGSRNNKNPKNCSFTCIYLWAIPEQLNNIGQIIPGGNWRVNGANITKT